MKYSDFAGMAITSLEPKDNGTVVLICRNYPGVVTKEVTLIFTPIVLDMNDDLDSKIVCEVEVETEKVVKSKNYEEVTL